MSEWINIKDRFAAKEKYYRCIALSFARPIKCKFKKGKKVVLNVFRVFLYIEAKSLLCIIGRK